MEMRFELLIVNDFEMKPSPSISNVSHNCISYLEFYFHLIHFCYVNLDGNPSSIQRQLNLYGFRCVNRVDEKGVYSHPQFIRGEYDSVRNIRRKRTWVVKGTGKLSNASKCTAKDDDEEAEEIDDAVNESESFNETENNDNQPLSQCEEIFSSDLCPAETSIDCCPQFVSTNSCSSLPCQLDSFFDELQDFCAEDFNLDNPFDLFFGEGSLLCQ